MKFLEKQGLWEHEEIGTCRNCGLETDWGWSDTPDGDIITACSLGCWGAYWDGKVAPQGGAKPPAPKVLDMDKWAKRIRAQGAIQRYWPGLHFVQSGNLDIIEYRLPDLSLAGALFHFSNCTGDGRKCPGQIAVWVYPAHQGQGIGSKLGCAAARHFGVDLGLQQWSKAGVAMTGKAFRNHPKAPAYRKVQDGSN